MNRLFLVFSTVLLFSACASGEEEDKKEPAALPAQYYYFPKANVYFDSANKEYLFLASSDTSWQTAQQIPAVMQAMMDKSVLIQNPSTPVWQENENHKLVYSALLYATPNDTVVKKTPKPAPKPKTEISPLPEKKEKKGIKRFFEKLFGNKKKTQKEAEKK